MYFTKAIAAAILAPTLALGLATPKVLKRSPEPAFENGKYIVGRQAEFENHETYTFTEGYIPDGLKVNAYPVNDQRGFYAENVAVRDGYLQLTQSAGPEFPYRGGEVQTVYENIKYASVRTVAILTETPGVCNGMFFFKSNSQETDIEWLSDANSVSNQGTRKLWLTNQENDGDGQKTYLAIDPPADPTNTEHEYRLDWTEGKVTWFVDGEQVFETTSDVPTESGPWLWNNWSNGDAGWSAGPPTEDAVFKIKSIDIYYNLE